MRQWQVFTIIGLLVIIAGAIIVPMGWQAWQNSRPEFEGIDGTGF